MSALVSPIASITRPLVCESAYEAGSTRRSSSSMPILNTVGSGPQGLGGAEHEHLLVITAGLDDAVAGEDVHALADDLAEAARLAHDHLRAQPDIGKGGERVLLAGQIGVNHEQGTPWLQHARNLPAE